jgi:hypothetical protein
MEQTEQVGRDALDELVDVPQRLTRQEDDELRRLHWFSQIGILAQRKRERLLELRLQDRRNEIRAPREFAEEQVEVKAGTKRRWFVFGSR